MSRRLLRAAVCALAFAALLLPRAAARAAGTDDGYVIRSMQVDVTAQTDRSLDVVETIDVHFNESRHGIIRDIPLYSSLERDISIENVSVEGAPYTHDGYGKITIGDPDRTVTGDVRYVIRYTLRHYADEEPAHDYLYFNLIGTDWDTRIEQFGATVRLPEQAEIERVTLTSGSYGSTGSDAASVERQGNLLIFRGLRALEAFEGVTVNVEMAEGAFPDAEVWQPALIFHRIAAQGTFDEYGTLHVEQAFDLTVNRPTYYSLWLLDNGEQNNSRLRNVQVVLPDGRVDDTFSGSGYVSVGLYDYAGQRVQFTLSYDRDYDLRAGSSLAVELLLYSGRSEFQCEQLDAVCDTPFAAQPPAARSYLNRSYGYFDSGSYTAQLRGGHAELHMAALDDPYDDVYFCCTMPETNFLRQPGALDFAAPAACVLVLGAVLLLAQVNRGRRLNPVPEYYPPEGINPAELGFIVDETADSRDIVSLISYWASQKLLHIQLRDSRHFALYKLREMDASHRGYERKLFGALWSLGSGELVCDFQLKDRFYKRVNEAIKAIKAQFTGVNALTDPRSASRSVLAGILAPELCLVLCILAVCLRRYIDPGAIVLLFLVEGIAALLYFAVSALLRRWYKGGAQRVFRLLLCAALFAGGWSLCYFPLAGRALPAAGAAVAAFCVNLLPAAAARIRRRTPTGRVLLERALGFRQFLATAEAPRLRLLLDQNPDYYYDILPYAQVLGVSNSWTHKFDGLLSQPPSWMDTGGMPAYFALNSLTKRMRAEMTSAPVESSGGGGGSSSSGGGFSGGGFSGGGSGGGGGRSW